MSVHQWMSVLSECLHSQSITDTPTDWSLPITESFCNCSHYLLYMHILPMEWLIQNNDSSKIITFCQHQQSKKSLSAAESLYVCWCSSLRIWPLYDLQYLKLPSISLLWLLLVAPQVPMFLTDIVPSWKQVKYMRHCPLLLFSHKEHTVEVYQQHCLCSHNDVKVRVHSKHLSYVCKSYSMTPLLNMLTAW